MSEQYNHAGALAFVYYPQIPGNEKRATETRSFVIENSDAARHLFQQYVRLHPDYEFGREGEGQHDSKAWTVGKYDVTNDEKFQQDYAPQIGALEVHEAVQVDYNTGQLADSTQEFARINLQREIENLVATAHSQAR